jgi:hypothetical protein
MSALYPERHLSRRASVIATLLHAALMTVYIFGMTWIAAALWSVGQ